MRATVRASSTSAARNGPAVGSGPAPAGEVPAAPQFSLGNVAIRSPERVAGGANRTGLPDRLKAGIERLSGYAMDDVRVRRNSPHPARIQAHAYAQGANIYLSPGQERHLPHEAWHVAQQKQGRVPTTLRLTGGIAVNDHDGLEREADRMGSAAATHAGGGAADAVPLSAPGPSSAPTAGPATSLPGAVVQGVFKKEDGNAMSDTELSTAIAAHPRAAELTPAMHGEIQRRHGHANQAYLLGNTIRDLADGTVAPKPPPVDGARTVTRREAAGLGNLPHMHPTMRPLFLANVNTPPPVPPVRTEREHLESPTRNFRAFSSPNHSKPPFLVQNHSNLVMGHGPEDAVDYWNRIGHTQARSANQAHNQSLSVFHGLEEKHLSAKSGGNTKSRYRSPSPSDGSHPEYWDRSHPNFNPNVSWHTYANATDAKNGVRYTPTFTSAIVSPSATLAKPVAAPAAPSSAATPFTAPGSLIASPIASSASSAFGAPSHAPVGPTHSGVSSASTDSDEEMDADSQDESHSDSDPETDEDMTFADPLPHHAAPSHPFGALQHHAYPAMGPPSPLFGLPSFGIQPPYAHQPASLPPAPSTMQPAADDYEPEPLEPLFGMDEAAFMGEDENY